MRNVYRESPLSTGAGNVVSPYPSPPEHVISAEEYLRMQQALGQLTVEHRRVIEMRNFERKSFGEIGECMERTDDAARKLWSRAVDRLGRLMEGDS
jgi:RNA polymerase sigma-70 factor (ECF subfamily)